MLVRYKDDRAEPLSRSISAGISAMQSSSASARSQTMPGTLAVPPPQAAFLPAAVDLQAPGGRAWPATAHVERADTLRPVDLVRRKAHQVHAERLHIEGNFAHGLGCVRMKQNAAVLAKPADFHQRLDGQRRSRCWPT